MFRIFGLASAALLASLSFAQPTFVHPDRIRYDSHCFTIDGKDTFVFSGAFHYFRCPRELWAERFKRIKEAGFNAVETYVAWNWSERNRPKGPDDFSQIDLKDLDAWLTMAENEFGLYTILRPGPYICSEWASGGFPNWLPTFKPAHAARSMWYRSDDPVFERWSKHWFDAVAKVARPHLLTNKPMGSHGVILWQVENEYDFADQPRDAKRNYVRFLMQCTKNAGIDVPIFGCWTDPIRHPEGDPILSQGFDNPNQYPWWDIEGAARAIADQHAAQPWAPKMITEFQGGWFGGVGGQAASELIGLDAAQIRALTLWAIGNGATGLNYYMLFGGTNFGDWAAEGITTSYDYNAPIREWGGVGDRYEEVRRIGNFLQQYGADIARSEPVDLSAADSAYTKYVARRGPSGRTYVFVWNSSRTQGSPFSFPGVQGWHLGPSDSFLYMFDDPKTPSGGRVVGGGTVPEVSLPKPMRVPTADVAQLTPTGWKRASKGLDTASLGVWDSRFLSYRIEAPKGGCYAWLSTISSEPVGPTLPVTDEIEGKRGYRLMEGSNGFLLFDPGWPNGGTGMEQPHGIDQLALTRSKPQGIALADWHTKMLDDQSDRSLVEPGVDTSGWIAGTATASFLPHTTGVLRCSVDLASPPDPEELLSCGGVDDEGWFYVNGHLVGEVHHWDTPVSCKVGTYLRPGHNDIAIVIHNIEGPGGLTGGVWLYAPLPKSDLIPARVDWTDSYKAGPATAYGLDANVRISDNEHPHIAGPRPVGGRLVRSTVRFDRPLDGHAWEIAIEAGGDGFLTLNGRPLGRYWEVGPQRGFFLPGPWLKDHNVLELTVVPGRLGDRIKAAELRPLS
jgi:hypothetical protein